MRYVTAVDMLLRHPETDAPILPVTWESACRTLFRDPRLLQALDVFTLMDVRRALLAAKAGDVVELDEEAWTALGAVLRRPASFSPDFVYAGEIFFRAFLDAPTTPPSASA